MLLKRGRLRFNISSGFRVFPKNVGTQEDPCNTCNSWLNFHHIFSSLSPRSNGCTSAGGVGTPERCNRRNGFHLEALPHPQSTNESAPSPVTLVKGLTSRTRAWTLDRCDLLAPKVWCFCCCFSRAMTTGGGNAFLLIFTDLLEEMLQFDVCLFFWNGLVETKKTRWMWIWFPEAPPARLFG